MYHELPQEEFLVRKIQRMVEKAGYLSREQVRRMFRKYGEETVEYQLSYLNRCRLINYNRDNGILSARVKPIRTEVEQKKMTTAFWVIANLGDEEVDEFWLTDMPSQLLWINRESNKIHDLTVIYPGDVRTTGYLRQRVNATWVPEGEPDVCDHIALVFNEEDGQEALEKWGFDRYCMLDIDDHTVSFYPNYDTSAQQETAD